MFEICHEEIIDNLSCDDRPGCSDRGAFAERKEDRATKSLRYFSSAYSCYSIIMVKALLLQFEEHDRKIFWTLSMLLFVLLAFYIYFLSISVYSVVSRKNAEAETSSLNAHIAGLESTYAVLDKNISLALAHERGFIDITVPKYLSGEESQTALSLHTGHSSR